MRGSGSPRPHTGGCKRVWGHQEAWGVVFRTDSSPAVHALGMPRTQERRSKGLVMTDLGCDMDFSGSRREA